MISSATILNGSIVAGEDTAGTIYSWDTGIGFPCFCSKETYNKLVKEANQELATYLLRIPEE